MSSQEETFVLPLPIEEAAERCRSAAAALGYQVTVERVTPRGLRPFTIVTAREAWRSWRTLRWYPVTLEAALVADGPTRTRCSLEGSMWGWGRLRDTHLRERVYELAAALPALLPGSAVPHRGRQP
jgi:hypothetical protein